MGRQFAGGAILLVILGHTIQYFAADFDTNHVANYIYSFHMPLFFMISGFCSGYSSSDLWKVVKKSAIQLLLPYLIWSFLLSWTMKYDWRDVVFINPRYWFLLVLLYIRLIHVGCRFVAHKLHIAEFIPSIAAIVLFGAAQFVVKTDIPCFSFIYYYMIYFVIGYHVCINFSKIKNVIANKSLLIAMTLVFLVWGFYFRRGSVPDFISFIPGFLYFIPLALVGCYISFSLFMNYMDKKFEILYFLGIHSLGIYVVSGYFCYIIFTYFQEIRVYTTRYWFLVYLLFVLISAMSSTIVLLLSRYSRMRPLIWLQVKHVS